MRGYLACEDRAARIKKGCEYDCKLTENVGVSAGEQVPAEKDQNSREADEKAGHFLRSHFIVLKPEV